MPGGSSNQFSYYLGATNVVVGLSTMTYVRPPQFSNFVQIGAVTGGTAFMAPLPAQGATPTVGSGVMVHTFGAGQVRVDGPACFWLSAVGATTTVGLMFGLSDSYGQSFFP